VKLLVKALGDIKADFVRETGTLKRSVHNGIKRGADGLKLELRKQVMDAGLGTRLANTWRAKVYPDQPVSMRPAAFVSSKAPDIMRAFGEGAVIRAYRRRWLAVPTKNAPKRGQDGKKLTPMNFPENRLGRLIFVERKSGPSFYIVKDVRKSFSQKTGAFRGYKKASNRAITRGEAEKFVVMFILLDQVTLKKRLDIQGAAQHWTNRLPDLIEQAFLEVSGGK
jgi:hypothetical protein